MAESRARRVTIGFHGGQTLPLRLAQDRLDSLRGALDAGGWHELQAEDGEVLLNLAKVVYLRTESEEQHVGF
ncbi:MAG TPA: hypothetical protein VHE14_00085 [Solirubrobacteraceae bacterium]|nr:hypothetical protein [Solirubrobacteraceae bacterium]